MKNSSDEIGLEKEGEEAGNRASGRVEESIAEKTNKGWPDCRWQMPVKEKHQLDMSEAKEFIDQVENSLAMWRIWIGVVSLRRFGNYFRRVIVLQSGTVL